MTKQATSREAGPPNILMIMADQHHAQCMGFAGHPDVKTPVIDALAAGGTAFGQAFCQNGVCVPSRMSWLTGQYCHTHGVLGESCAPDVAQSPSLGKTLQAAGYDTALIGKKHLPHSFQAGFDDQRLCYQADTELRDIHYYQYLRQRGLQAYYDDLGDVNCFCLSDDTLPVEHSLEVWTANEAIDYLQQHDASHPFFMQLSFERPHPPMTVPRGCPFVYDPSSLTLPPNQKEFVDDSLFTFARNVELKWCTSFHGEQKLREALCAYYSLISLIDQQMGRVLEQLEQSGLRENTLIVYCADHGDFAGEYGKMAKGWSYDAIYRIPLIYHWPGHVESGKQKDCLVETIDFFPTVCELAEVAVPRHVQGRNLWPILRGEVEQDREAVFYEYTAIKTVRTANFKLNYCPAVAGALGELFDLKKDPHEYVNEFDNPQYATVRMQLISRLLDWMINTQQPASHSVVEMLPMSRWFER